MARVATVGLPNEKAKKMSSFYSKEMIEETSREAAEALTRTADWMAKQTMQNMLRVNPDAAAAHGGQEQLLGKLRSSYQNSLTLAG